MNKIILIIVIILSSTLAGQTNYYVELTGSRNFKSIQEVNGANLKSGDIVNFQAGQQFSDAQLVCKSGVTYTSYGTGKAIIGSPTQTLFESSILVDNVTNVSITNLLIYSPATSTNQAIKLNSSINFTSPNLTPDFNINIKGCDIVGGNNSTIGNGIGILSSGGIKGFTISNSKIHYFRKGIKISFPYNTLIENNEIYDVFYYDPDKGIYNTGVRGAEGMELYGIYNGNAWDCNYTVIVRSNNIYDFETSGMITTTLSKVIIEYNEIHDNLDERVYHGGIDHAHGLGKIDDYSFGDGINFPGPLGTIVRFNKVYNVKRHQKSAKYTATAGYPFKYNGSQYESDGSVYLHKYYSSLGVGPYSIGACALDGSGVSTKFYGNLVFDCDKVGITRTAKSGTYDFTNQSQYYNEIYNNTFYNVGYDSLLYRGEYGGASIVRVVETTSPTYVRNNIFYMSNTGGSAIYSQKAPLYEGNNIFINGNGVVTDKGGDDNKISPPVGIFVANTAEYNQIGNTSTFNISISQANNIFMDVVKKDFRLKPGSIAIGTGIDLGNAPDGEKYQPQGYAGGTMDIGAFAYGIDNSDDNNIPDINEESTIASPTIVTQPTSQNINLGNDVSFSINATCDDPMGYQWWKDPFISESESKIVDNSKFSGATTNTLTIKNASEDDAKIKYICEVYNTKDNSNYWVNSNAVSIIVSSPNSQVFNGLRVFLEGAAKSDGSLNNNLVLSSSFPIKQPYNISPWNYNNNESVNPLKSNFTDWILVELKSDLSNSEYIKAGILSVDGYITNSDGTPFSFSNITSGNYYLAVHHRNHLSIISATSISVVNNESITYDFTSSATSAFGDKSQIQLSNGKSAMIAGDADGNGIINSLDFGIVANNIPSKGYLLGDIDMNGIVNVLDYSKINANILKKSYLQ